MMTSLRRKFMLINMLLVSLVLVIVFTSLTINDYGRLQKESQDALERALNRPEGQAPPNFEIGQRPSNDAFPPSPTIVVALDGGDSPRKLSAEFIEVSQAKLEHIVQDTRATGKSSGILPSYHLRFQMKEVQGVTRIAYIDLTHEQETMRSSMLSSLSFGVIALVGFFLVSLFLSSWAVRPVKRAWEQQRQFVADASHELKTPLTVILANTGILQSHPTDTVRKQMKWVNNTQAEAGRMKELVDQLLFLAKADASHVVDLSQELPFSDIVTSAALAIESLAFEKGIALQMDIVPELIVRGDELQLRQLIAILLDNAIKFTEEQGTITLTVKPQHERVLLRVNNTGTPIERADMERLFERFYRADPSRQRRSEGYGLGLSIAKSIVDLHKGKIHVESDATSGTTFTVSLRLSSGGK